MSLSAEKPLESDGITLNYRESSPHTALYFGCLVLTLRVWTYLQKTHIRPRRSTFGAEEADTLFGPCYEYYLLYGSERVWSSVVEGW